MKQETQPARAQTQNVELQRENFGSASSESRRSFLGTLAKTAGTALGAIALMQALGSKAQAREKISIEPKDTILTVATLSIRAVQHNHSGMRARRQRKL